MQAVILAGGLGTRLRTIAGDLPKSLVPVAGKPLIEHQLELLKAQGLSRALILIGYQGELIRNYVRSGSRYGMKVTYSEEQPRRLMGTGGALVGALTDLEDEFLVLHGDTYAPLDYPGLISWYREQERPAAIAVHPAAKGGTDGNLRILGERVIQISGPGEDGSGSYCDAGVSVLTLSIVQRYLVAPLPLDLTALLRDLVEEDELAAYKGRNRSLKISRPEDVRVLESYLAANA